MKKKLLALALSALLVFTLSACGKSEAAQAVDNQIAAIGEITEESEPLITAAEEAVAALAAEDKEQLDNLEMLEQARADYQNLLLAGEAAKVDEAIAAIGTVTLDSADAIESARALYDGCESDVKALVSALPDLEAAEAALTDLQVQEVTDLIDAIGTVSAESAGAIAQAQEAYDALAEDLKGRVTNAAALETASAQLKEQAQQILDGMRLSEDKVQNLRFYYPDGWRWYDSNTWAADIRSFVLPYLGQDDTRTWMRLVCNYTGDDWVFFDSLIFAVDGKQYTKSFSYFDVTRDNASGDVWEYVDLDVSNASDIELLWAIANSTEAIVRFQGDDYSHDMTFTADDKAAIRDCLIVYEAFQ